MRINLCQIVLDMTKDSKDPLPYSRPSLWGLRCLSCHDGLKLQREKIFFWILSWKHFLVETV